MEGRKETTQIKPVNLSELPEEILILIFTFLDSASLFTLFLLSKQFKRLSEDKSLANNRSYWLAVKPKEKTFIGHEDCIKEFLITETQGKKIVVAMGAHSSHVESRDLQTGELLHRFEHTTTMNFFISPINSITFFHHDEKILLATASSANTIRIWDLKTGKHLKTLIGSTKKIQCMITFSNNGKTFLVSGSSDKTIRIWDWKEKKCLKILEGHQQEITHLQILLEEKPLIISASSDGTLGVWDPETGKCRQEIKKDPPSPITYLGISNELNSDLYEPGKSRIISCYADSNHIYHWNANDGSCMITDYFFPTFLKPSPFYFPKSNNTIKVLGLSNTIHTLQHDNQITQAVFLKKNKEFFLVSMDLLNLYIWDLQTGKCLQKLAVCSVVDVMLSKHLKLFAGMQGELQVICSLRNKITLFTFDPQKANIFELSSSSDSSTSDKEARGITITPEPDLSYLFFSTSRSYCLSPYGRGYGRVRAQYSSDSEEEENNNNSFTPGK